MAGIGCLGWQPVCVEPLKITPQLFAARCSLPVQLLSNGDGLTWLYHHLDCRPHLSIDFNVHKLGNTANVDPFFRQITLRQHHRLDRLVDRTCANGLHFGMLVFSNDSGNCPRYSGST